MKFVSFGVALALCWGATAHAQSTRPTHYEDLAVGTTVQEGLGLGMFAKPFPMPPGKWTLLQHSVKDIPVFNTRTREASGSVAKHDLTFKNSEPGGMVPLMFVSITGRLSNLDNGKKPCNPSTNKNQWVDNFSDLSKAEVASYSAFVCATSVGLSNFKKMVVDAPSSSSPWVKAVLSPVAPEASTLPDNVLLVNINASRFRGFAYDVVFFVRQEGNLSDPAYAAHVQPWIHATGLSLLASTEGGASSMALPLPYADAAAKPVRIDNRVQSTFTDTVPLSDIRIRKTFDLIDLTADDLKAQLVACIPQFDRNFAPPNVPMQSVVSTMFKISGSSKTFVLKKSKGLCLQSSSNNYPIFAAEAFAGMVTPVGVSEEVVSDWNAQIARLVAIKGTATVAYPHPDHGAMAVKFWMDATNPIMIRYSAQFKGQAEWNPQSFDLVLTDPGLTAATPVNIDAKGLGKKDAPF